jgi:hypothetical protein
MQLPWTVPGEDRDPPFSVDALLTDVMLYWLGRANPASWYYLSLYGGHLRQLPEGRRVEVPTGFLLTPRDTTLFPRTACSNAPTTSSIAGTPPTVATSWPSSNRRCTSTKCVPSSVRFAVRPSLARNPATLLLRGTRPGRRTQARVISLTAARPLRVRG